MEPLELVPGKLIGRDLPCFIVAEIGQNHQGDINVAKTLIKKAKESGADCVKLQKSCLTAKFNKAALSRPYNLPDSWGITYGEHKDFLEFSSEEFKDLQNFAHNESIPLTASAMDIVTVDFLDDLDVPFLKIGSGDAHNLPLIRRAASTGRPLVISTGMCDIVWVSEIYKDLTFHAPATPIVLLQCTSSYPTPSTHAHLRVMDSYSKMFPRAHVGYSGHELGTDISIAAVARGARVLERHLTLNKDWKGSDHRCSLEPDEFSQMVAAIRNVESALGSPTKAFQSSEEACFRKLGKSVVATRYITAGEELEEDDLICKVTEPPGIPAMNLFQLVGRTVRRDIEEDDRVLEENLVP